MNIIFIYFAAFIGVLIATDTVSRLLRDKVKARHFVNYRLSLIGENADRKVVYQRMLKERGLNDRENQRVVGFLKSLLVQSGQRISIPRAFSYALTATTLFFLLFSYLEFTPLWAVFLSLLCTSVAAFLVLLRMRSKRLNAFISQMPETLDVMVRSLSAGHPLPTSISLVGREMPDPIGTEFGLMSDELTYGTDIDVALRNMEVRVGASELNLLAIALTVQKGSGGNLSEILSNLADMLRRRIMMKAKIKAISAEGRMTSWFMLGFPFFLYGMISLINREYFDPIWDSGNGHIFLIVAAVIMTIGMLILRKIVNFDY